jgi:hypothetical protein
MMRYALIDWTASPPAMLKLLDLQTEPQGVRIVNGNPLLIPVVEGIVPPYNSALQRIVRTTAIVAGEYRITYEAINLTPEEIEMRIIEQEVSNIDLRTVSRLIRDNLVTLEELSQEEIDELIGLYPLYRVSVWYDVGFVFNYEGTLYRVIQAHTTQQDWEPPTTPALYVVVTPPGTIAPWVQPTGAHDAYNMGDRVSHNGKIWESTINANVWEPGVHGWVEV